MSGRGLPIVTERRLSQREQLEFETKTALEQAWEQVPPFNFSEKRRLKRLRSMLERFPPEGNIVDLGCGDGRVTAHFPHVTGIDVAENALKRCPEHFSTLQRFLPYHKLPEESFDGVVCTDVIAEISSHLHRLMLSEVASLLKRGGLFLCSTPLDRSYYDACENFLELISTEFEIIELEKNRGWVAIIGRIKSFL